jgi:hypothetical protein
MSNPVQSCCLLRLLAPRGLITSVLLVAACSGPVKSAAPAGTPPEEARAMARKVDPILGPPRGPWKAATKAGPALLSQERFQNMAVVGRAADGSLRVECVSSAAELEVMFGTRAAGARADGGR